jgi:DNA-binding MarR family transcriptional regulator
MGRPAKPPGEVRRRRVITFLTDNEFAKLETLADEKDKSLSAVLYEILSRALKRRK